MTQYYNLEQLIYKWVEQKMGQVSTLPGLEMVSVTLRNYEDINVLVAQGSYVASLRSKTKQWSVQEWQTLLNAVPELKAVPGIMLADVGGTNVNRTGSPPQWEYSIQFDIRYRKGQPWVLPEN